MAETEVCGAVHPTEDVRCELPPGTNAYSDDRKKNVHVHRGRIHDAVYRWEGGESSDTPMTRGGVGG